MDAAEQKHVDQAPKYALIFRFAVGLPWVAEHECLLSKSGQQDEEDEAGVPEEREGEGGGKPP